MKRFMAWLLVLLFPLAVVAGWFYASLNRIEVEQLSDDLWVLRGMQSGNVAVLATGEGAVVVDSMISVTQGQRIREKAKELTGEEVTVVINTHYHLDHSSGNPGFESGVRVMATGKSLGYMTGRDAERWQGSNALFLPNEIIQGNRLIKVGRKTLRLLNPGRGHTDGDLAVLFVEEKVLHTGDLYFNGYYPNIDLEAGGSVQEWPDTLDRLFALNFDRIIPGHGPTTDAAGMRQFQAFMTQLAELGRHAVATGASLDETLVNGWLNEDEGYEPIGLPLIMLIDRDFVISRAWQEATGSVEGSP